MQTKNYTYGAKPPIEGIELVDEQIKLAHKYYNKLIELHREKRDAVSAIRSRLCPELEHAEAAVSAAEQAVDDCVDMIRSNNAIARRKRATPEENVVLSALKESRAVAWAQLKEIRQRVKEDPAIAAALESIYVEFDGVPVPDSDTNRRKGGKFKAAMSIRS